MDRYSRQILLDKIGKEGQKKLLGTHVSIVGCGGLGSLVAPYLAGAGVGHLTLIDGDKPHISNVHRQVFFTGSESSSKAQVLASHIKKINPNVEVEVIDKMVHKNNIADILRPKSIVVECTDDMMTKYLVNDYCHVKRMPLIYGAIFKYEGYVSVFENKSDESIHLRDIFPEPDTAIPSCSEVGVLNTTAGLIAMLQANETLKYILKIGESLTEKLLTYDCLSNRQTKLKLKKVYRSDMPSLFSTFDYASIHCLTIPERSWQDVYDDKSINLVSILETDEHVLLTNDAQHKALSRTSIAEYSKEEDQTVFYCMSGKRSAQLVKKLSLQYPNKVFYSLKGGAEAAQKSIKDER